MKNRGLLPVIKLIELRPLYLLSLTVISLVPFAINYLVAAFFADMTAAIGAGDLSVLLSMLVQTAVLLGATALIGSLAYYLFAYVGNRTTASLRTLTFAKIQRLPVSYLEEHHSGDLTSRVTNDLKTLETLYSLKLRAIFRSVLSGTAALAVMLIKSPQLAAFALSWGLLFTLTNSRFAKTVREISDQVQERLGKLTERLADLLAGAHTTTILA